MLLTKSLGSLAVLAVLVASCRHRDSPPAGGLCYRIFPTSRGTYSVNATDCMEGRTDDDLPNLSRGSLVEISRQECSYTSAWVVVRRSRRAIVVRETIEEYARRELDHHPKHGEGAVRPVSDENLTSTSCEWEGCVFETEYGSHGEVLGRRIVETCPGGPRTLDELSFQLQNPLPRIA